MATAARADAEARGKCVENANVFPGLLDMAKNDERRDQG